MKKAAKILFIYTLLVILWGAWVRISHSGDGCGESWPLCHDQLIPGMDGQMEPPGKTWVEYTHRLMSGLYGLFVLALWFNVMKRLPKAHQARKAAHTVLLLTITEALLGAKLVIFGLVHINQSWFRTFAMSLHQVNSVLLSGAVVVLILALQSPGLRWRPQAKVMATAFVLIAVSGAWAALASTLFPSETLWEGLMKDFAPDSHHVLRLRILHPLLALFIGGTIAGLLWMKSQTDEKDRPLHLQTALAFVAAILFGMITLLMLSPVWMKVAHLAIAHLLWACLIRWFYSIKPLDAKK